MKKCLLLPFLFISSFLLAQNPKIDSLLNLLKTDKQDTNNVIHLNKLCNEFSFVGEFNKGLNYGKQALALAQNSAYKKGMATAYNNLGNMYCMLGNYPLDLQNYSASLKIRQQIKDKHGVADSYSNMANIDLYLGNYPTALKSYFAALKIYEETNDKQSVSDTYNNIGCVYEKQNNFSEALKNYLAALKMQQANNNIKGIAIAKSNIGNLYLDKNNYDLALQNLCAALKIYEEIGDKRGISITHSNIGNIYLTQGNYTEALKNFLTALKMHQETGDKKGEAICFESLGQLYNRQHKIKEATLYLNKALPLAQEIGDKDVIKNTYSDLAVLDSITGNFKAAFAHYKLFIAYRDSLNNEETKKQSLQTSMQYEFDKKEIATKAAQDKLDAINAEEKQKQRIIIYAVAGLLLLVAVFAVFMYNRFRITHQQKQIIEEQKVLVDKAYESLHEKNKEVMDSIRYAKRIQTALITSEKYIAASLNKLMKSK